VSGILDGSGSPPGIPTSVRRREATQRFPALAPEYFAGMWRGDPLADAFVADAVAIGTGRAMRMVRIEIEQLLVRRRGDPGPGTADMISIGRGLIADPDIITKIRMGRRGHRGPDGSRTLECDTVVTAFGVRPEQLWRPR